MPLSAVSPISVDDVIHGEIVHDPFRWLEDRSLPDTQKWIEEQQKRCNSYFSEFDDLDSIRDQVRAYLDVEIVDQPARVRNRYFYRRRQRGQEQACIYVRDVITKRERLLVDPQFMGPFVSVGIYSISNDGSLLAYELREGGGDRSIICFVDVDRGEVLQDRLENGYVRGLAFTGDNRGFFYSHDTSTLTKEHTLRFHLFHEPRREHVVFRVPRSLESRLVLAADAEHLGAIWTRRRDNDLVATLWRARRNNPSGWHQILANRTLPFCPMLKHGRIFAITCEGAPNGKLVELNESGVEVRTIVPEANATSQVLFTKDKVYANYLEGRTASIQCRSLSGQDLGPIKIPSDGTIRFLPKLNDREDGFFFAYESFEEPTAIFEYLPSLAEPQVWHRRLLPSPRRSIRVTHSTYRATDGTPIPITLVARDSASLTRRAPVIMTSYGGFGVSSTPQFSVLVTILLDSGAIFAMPHIRGGGEFGNEWHEAARGRKRQVSFDDFLAAARWLCDSGITSPSQLAIFGGSNSGLLVGAAMTQRPDLFCAVICIAPLLDMVRYEQFDQAVKWRHEYGQVDDPEDFRALHAYSPYHCIQPEIDYPAVMFVSGDKDDRCNPAHVRKTAARLQERDAQKRPVLVDYSEYRGHSPVLPLCVRIEALARRIAFLCRELNLPTCSGGPQ